MPKRHRPGQSATSLLSHIEEIVVGSSGQDVFELVFALAAARIVTSPSSSRSGRGRSEASSERHAAVADTTLRPRTVRPRSRASADARSLRARILQAQKACPSLGVTLPRDASDALLCRVDALLDLALPKATSAKSRRSRPEATVGALDAVFESLVSRVAKADKGQFFTPRHVVDFIVRALGVRSREVIVDPACGSGAFLSHARAHARVVTFGTDVDARAVRLARLGAVAQGRDPSTIDRRDALRRGGKRDAAPRANVVATNPPFAGRVDGAGFEVADVVRTPERDVLFLERALELLEPGGRLGIVLPYNKANGAAYAGLRRWLVARARLFAVVALPRETFLPHTSQRTFVLFAKKRAPLTEVDLEERCLFAISERAGKDAGGQPLRKPGTDELDHDLDSVLAKLAPFLEREGFAS